MRSFSTLASVTALLLATTVPVEAAWAQTTPANVDELRAALKALQQEQQSTDEKIRALEQRINALDPNGALNSQSRVPDANAALMRGRGVGSIDGDAPAAAPEEASVTPPEDEARKTPATSQVVQAVTENQQGYFGKHISIDPGINYSHFTNARLDLNGFLALDAIFLGLISIDELNADVITTDVTGRYSVGRLQADLNVPYLYRRSNFRSGGAGGNASGLIERTIETHGLGDISAGLSYRLMKETTARPDIVVNVHGRAPTGRDPFGIELTEVEGSQGNLKIPTRLSTGSGVWGAEAGVSVLKTIDPMIVFGSLTYFHNFNRHFPDLDEAQDNQPGDAHLGDSFQYGIGFAFALNDQSSLDTSITQRFVRHSKLRFDPKDPTDKAEWQTVVGSEANVGVLNLGATFSLTPRVTLIANVGVGITEDAPDMDVSVRLPYQF